MGARGPQPTPTATLKLRGSWRGEVRDGEPAAAVEAPEAPEWLSEEARGEWDRVVPELIGRGTLAKADRAMLALYCHAWGQFVGAVNDADLHLIESSAARLMKAADRFGLSPAAKARVRAVDPADKPKTGLDAFKLKRA